MITWSGDEDRQEAFATYSENIDSYTGLGKSSANSRTFLNIESNRSVRPQFTKRDYYSFREAERVPNNQKRIIKMCMDAYDKVGIIRNVVDLMGDFGAQGIRIVHPNKRIERFYQKWFEKCGGKERSERFLNNLYKSGNVVVNRQTGKLTLKTAEKIKETFFEVIICSEIEPAAKTLLSSKKNMRIILQNSKDQDSQKITSVSGGLLIQDDDLEQISKDQLQIVTKRKPTEEETTNLLFAFKCIKHIRSNAIAFIQNGQTIGIGAGQMSRVDSVKIANIKMQQFDNYNEDAPLIIASDAFFPFADGVEIAAASGATAIIQPGGSKRDQEVIDAADKANIAMVFTGLRHFKH